MVVGGYLLVIVPLNWLLFRLIGRIEWAWLAVPLIALGGAAVVIHLAQVDIGFARSMTEIAVVEIQPKYSRSHVTRYTALYTSLSSTYDLRFADSGALALPLGNDAGLLTGQGRSMVSFDQSSEASLTDFPVSSNSTGLVHCEQMYELGGDFSLDESVATAPRVVNNSKLTLSGAAVVRKSDDGDSLEAGWIGELPAGEKKEFRLEDFDLAALTDRRAESALTADKSGVGGLTVQSLVELAEHKLNLEPGEVRLVGWSDQEIPGLAIEPASSQARHATVIVAHLRYQPSAPRPDTNSRADFPNARSREVREEDFEVLPENEGK
jgi:hypothetical protein